MPGTKYRSNCSRERPALNASVPSLNNADVERAFVNSSYSIRSSRSRSSSRIWNQLTSATTNPYATNAAATCADSEFA